MEASQGASGEPGTWLLAELDWFGINKDHVHPQNDCHKLNHQQQPKHSKSNALGADKTFSPNELPQSHPNAFGHLL